MLRKKVFVKLTFFIGILIALGLLFIPVAHAQYWAAIPPYNTLWPLWYLFLTLFSL